MRPRAWIRLNLSILVVVVFCLFICIVAASAEKETCKDGEVCSATFNKQTGVGAKEPIKQLPKHAWFNALASTAVISVFGNIGIVFYLFIDNRVGSGWLLKTMIGFAVGGLLGDVFLHLLPHASTGDAHDITGGLWILFGIFAFFLVEKLVRIWTGGEHSHSHSEPKDGVKADNVQNGIRPGAWLNMFADVTHNFVDGMAIAAAFQTSSVLGTSTTLGVLIHEIPHEMGDFAVLLSQGFSKRGAFLCQFVSALGAFAGCLFGLMIAKADSEPTAVLNFTAGGFIYVALVDVLPELLSEPSSFIQLLREIAALCLGVAVMIYVATLEAHDHSQHSHNHVGHAHHGHSHAH
jgi:zinc transporter 7